MTSESGGALDGLRVIELAGLGPAPFCGMLLADYGADVVRVERPRVRADDDLASVAAGLNQRGRRSIVVDLKSPDGATVLGDMIAAADALIEGFRPGVMERLGLGPDECLDRNPSLVYGRVTGWGQNGPYAHAPGHDINYVALSGALEPIGEAGRGPVVPLNLLGDFAGGGMLLALGVAVALVEAARSGQGQVVDAAMVDGAALLTTLLHERRAAGEWVDRRGANVADGGAPFYSVYETADGKYVSVGAIEPQFYRSLLELTGLQAADLPPQGDSSSWPATKERLAAIFRQRTRDEWCEVLDGTDACFAPVLSPGEAPKHRHNAARETFTDVDGVLQPAPAPRFSRTPARIRHAAPRRGEHTEQVLAQFGFSAARIEHLREAGAIG